MIYQFWIACKKELAVILKDSSGLMILFIMPMALVLIVTLVQDNILKKDQEVQVELLVLNEDKGALSLELLEQLEDSTQFNLHRKLNGENPTTQSMQKAIAGGSFQAAIYFPPNVSKLIEKKVEWLLNSKGQKAPKGETVTLMLDPAIKKALQSSLATGFDQMMQTLMNRLLLEKLGEVLELLEVDPSAMKIPDQKTMADLLRSTVNHEFAMKDKSGKLPNAVQHNVPAWSMFGIFFIVLPISGAILKERSDGISRRLRSMPVSSFTLYSAKVLIYSVLNLIQLGLMLLVGVLILPLFGTPVLDLGTRPDLILLAGFCSALAATSLGLLLGNFLKSYYQASVVGPILVVIAAALGGLMVPTFMMPAFMRRFSDYSPLHWGYEAFIEIFVRSSDFVDLIPSLSKLVLFFLVNFTLSLLLLRKKD